MPIAWAAYKHVTAGWDVIKDFEWAVAPMPRGTRRMHHVSPQAFAAVSQTKHPDEAWTVVRHYSTGEANEIMATVSSMPSYKRTDVYKVAAVPSERRWMIKLLHDALTAGKALVPHPNIKLEMNQAMTAGSTTCSTSKLSPRRRPSRARTRSTRSSTSSASSGSPPRPGAPRQRTTGARRRPGARGRAGYQATPASAAPARGRPRAPSVPGRLARVGRRAAWACVLAGEQDLSDAFLGRDSLELGDVGGARLRVLLRGAGRRRRSGRGRTCRRTRSPAGTPVIERAARKRF